MAIIQLAIAFSFGLLSDILYISGTNSELANSEHTEVPQSTQATIGPYELQDFTLYHLLRHGLRPRRIAFLAHHAWRDVAAGHWPAGLPEEDRHS